MLQGLLSHLYCLNKQYQGIGLGDYTHTTIDRTLINGSVVGSNNEQAITHSNEENKNL